jgi:hypothetical protein
MASRRFGQGTSSERVGVSRRYFRGFVIVKLPRHVIHKRLKSGYIGYYYNLPSRYRSLQCPIISEPLGTDYGMACKRAATINELFDEWERSRRGFPISGISAPRTGTVDWVFREYKQSKAFTEKVAVRSRGNYEWAMRELCNIKTKTGDRIGDRPIKSITARGADKIYERLMIGSKGQRLRTAEKIVKLARKAWRVVRRLFPNEFDKDVPNPWDGVTMKSRVKLTKPAVNREQVYAFAWGCIERGEPECAAAAVICFEWLQRPENVIAGHIKWSGYRSRPKPTIQIEHHKTGAIVNHPLEERLEDGSLVKFYEDAESILSHLSRRGLPMILREVEEGKAKPYSFSGMQKIVQRMRKEIGLPPEFTLDACRHGGMTELEESDLTDGQGRALSAHRTQQSYAGYAKRTEARILSATRKRHAHRLANQTTTSIQNEPAGVVQNEKAVNARSV